GMHGVTSAAGGAAIRIARSATASVGRNADAGRDAAWTATGGAPTASMTERSAGSATVSAPTWARRLRSEQTARANRHAAMQAVRDGDRPGGSANPSLNDKDD
ncbi:MAG: P-type conjugative transfer protein TrbL, partial [Mesorhizobium sp.]